MIKLFFKVLLGNYKYHLAMSLLIFGAYMVDTFIPNENTMSLWDAYGPITLIIPLITGIPIILMCRHSYQHFQSIKKYYDKNGNRI
jgi:hypothetical protein